MTELPSSPDAWLGRTRTVEATIDLERARALAATLDRDPEALEMGSELPPGWHWIYFNELARASALGVDGHAERGGFLPPVPHPHRMWAGGRLSFGGPLRIGDAAIRRSTIESIEEKEGRSGPLVFVTVRHRVSSGGALAINEAQQLVFLTRDRSVGAQPRSARADAPRPDWSEPFVADEVALFRFSALTLNSHRIHYDEPYATGIEGYPGLVVHGPLIALLLVDAGARHAPPGKRPAVFSYRARNPLFCGEPFVIEGSMSGSMQLAATHAERGVATEATLELRDDGQ